MSVASCRGIFLCLMSCLIACVAYSRFGFRFAIGFRSVVVCVVGFCPAVRPDSVRRPSSAWPWPARPWRLAPPHAPPCPGLSFPHSILSCTTPSLSHLSLFPWCHRFWRRLSPDLDPEVSSPPLSFSFSSPSPPLSSSPRALPCTPLATRAPSPAHPGGLALSGLAAPRPSRPSLPGGLPVPRRPRVPSRPRAPAPWRPRVTGGPVPLGPHALARPRDPASPAALASRRPCPCPRQSVPQRSCPLPRRGSRAPARVVHSHALDRGCAMFNF
jgi:hypothetical protein